MRMKKTLACFRRAPNVKNQTLAGTIVDRSLRLRGLISIIYVVVIYGITVAWVVHIKVTSEVLTAEIARTNVLSLKIYEDYVRAQSLDNGVAAAEALEAVRSGLISREVALKALDLLGHLARPPMIYAFNVLALFVIACRLLEARVTRRRMADGAFGDEAYELRELVAPLVLRIERGRKPDDPDQMFPRRQSRQAEGSVFGSEGARS
jgi:hypothetical protein